jgi:hypothetical protein
VRLVDDAVFVPKRVVAHRRLLVTGCSFHVLFRTGDPLP